VALGSGGPVVTISGWDAYVTDFLTRAREAGHAVPEVAFQLALDNLRNRLAYAGDLGGGWRGIRLRGGRRTRARRVARIWPMPSTSWPATPAPSSVICAITPRPSSMPSPPPWRGPQLGAALALYGDKPRADRAFASALALLNEGEADLGWRLDFGSSLRDAAALLALAAESGTGAVDLVALAARIDRLGALDGRLSTQEQAWLLLAAQALMEGAAIRDCLVNNLLIYNEKNLKIHDHLPPCNFIWKFKYGFSR
jgi:uncharacterized protein YfaS (alpha-2-macroglobulin family)